jgi:hypothetical protein
VAGAPSTPGAASSTTSPAAVDGANAASAPRLSASHLDDVDLDVVTDADRLADAAGECEHEYPSMGVW